jgi:hypothetical protein
MDFIKTKTFFTLLFVVVETGSQHVAQVGLKHTILLPQHPECWNDRHAPLYLANHHSTKDTISGKTTHR